MTGLATKAIDSPQEAKQESPLSGVGRCQHFWVSRLLANPLPAQLGFAVHDPHPASTVRTVRKEEVPAPTPPLTEETLVLPLEVNRLLLLPARSLKASTVETCVESVQVAWIAALLLSVVS